LEQKLNCTSALKDLRELVAFSVAIYNEEFIWQDIKLTDEFKLFFKSVMDNSNADVSFFVNTAVVTTSKNRQIFVPNQWFVIASYVIDLCNELKAYQSLYFKVADSLHKEYEEFAKELRNSSTSYLYHDDFLEKAEEILTDEYSIPSQEIKMSVINLWRFCTDYTWWAGQKTIDRGDFMNSTILSILNLVAASQGFVADIVSYYLGNEKLLDLVKSPENFTEDMALNPHTPISALVDGCKDLTEVGNRTLQDSNRVQNEDKIADEKSTSQHKITISRSSLDKFCKN